MQVQSVVMLDRQISFRRLLLSSVCSACSKMAADTRQRLRFPPIPVGWCVQCFYEFGVLLLVTVIPRHFSLANHVRSRLCDSFSGSSLRRNPGLSFVLEDHQYSLSVDWRNLCAKSSQYTRDCASKERPPHPTHPGW